MDMYPSSPTTANQILCTITNGKDTFVYIHALLLALLDNGQNALGDRSKREEILAMRALYDQVLRKLAGKQPIL
jgi:hypothetical protein